MNALIRTVGTWLSSYRGYVVLASCSVMLLLVTTSFPLFPVKPSLFSVGKRYHCHLLQVIDGDSIQARCNGKTLQIRLQDIDAPEMGQGDWGNQAKQQLAQQLSPTLQIAFDGMDTFQRYLGRVYQNGEDINLAMLTSGFARVYSRYQPPADYRKAMQAAKSAQRGIWANPGLQQNPQRWRRLMQ